MTSRERLRAALRHQPVDRLCVDFGASAVTGIAAGAVHNLRQSLLGPSGFRVKVVEPYQMLGEIDEELRGILGIDVIGVYAPRNMFGFPNRDWKPFLLNDGIPVQVPEGFNTRREPNGRVYMYPEGDRTVPPCAVMPRTGYFFDALNRQPPLDEESLDAADNCEEFTILSDGDLRHFAAEARRLHDLTDCGLFLNMPGLAFGDIALVPALWLKSPRGIRDVEEWYASLLLRKDYVRKVFDHQCGIGLRNIELMAQAVGDLVDVVFVSGTDFGTQQGPFMSAASYRELFKPYHAAVNAKIHELTGWKTFIHSCGSVYDLIPEFIDAGFDIFNPVQCSARDMDPRRLKAEFGRDLVFWGGGVDTQKTLPFGTPGEVYREVRERIEIFSEGGGFVFNSIHNILGNVPVENILALFRAVKDSGNL